MIIGLLIIASWRYRHAPLHMAVMPAIAACIAGTLCMLTRAAAARGRRRRIIDHQGRHQGHAPAPAIPSAQRAQEMCLIRTWSIMAANCCGRAILGPAEEP